MLRIIYGGWIGAEVGKRCCLLYAGEELGDGDGIGCGIGCSERKS